MLVNGVPTGESACLIDEHRLHVQVARRDVIVIVVVVVIVIVLPEKIIPRMLPTQRLQDCTLRMLAMRQLREVNHGTGDVGSHRRPGVAGDLRDPSPPGEVRHDASGASPPGEDRNDGSASDVRVLRKDISAARRWPADTTFRASARAGSSKVLVSSPGSREVRMPRPSKVQRAPADSNALTHERASVRVDDANTTLLPSGASAGQHGAYFPRRCCFVSETTALRNCGDANGMWSDIVRGKAIRGESARLNGHARRAFRAQAVVHAESVLVQRQILTLPCDTDCPPDDGNRMQPKLLELERSLLEAMICQWAPIGDSGGGGGGSRGGSPLLHGRCRRLRRCRGRATGWQNAWPWALVAARAVGLLAGLVGYRPQSVVFSSTSEAAPWQSEWRRDQHPPRRDQRHAASIPRSCRGSSHP
eukprot:7388664-Prymnesium_polylepis.3